MHHSEASGRQGMTPSAAFPVRPTINPISTITVTETDAAMAEILLGNVSMEPWPHTFGDVSGLTEEAAEMAIDSALAIGCNPATGDDQLFPKVSL